VITHNDFRQTGARGWDDETTGGCILLFSDIDIGGLWDAGWWEMYDSTYVMNNVIFESGRLPQGTGGPSKQVYVLNNNLPPLILS